MTVPAAPRGSHTRARQFWRDLHTDRTPGPRETVLLVEACRLMDRLDRLAAALDGGRFLRLQYEERFGSPTDRLEVVVDSALGEARLHATALKAIVAELRQHDDLVKVENAGSASKGGDLADQLRARREGRRSDTTGGELPTVHGFGGSGSDRPG